MFDLYFPKAAALEPDNRLTALDETEPASPRNEVEKILTTNLVE